MPGISISDLICAGDLIVPTLCVGMPQRTLRVRLLKGRGASRAAFPRRAWERSDLKALRADDSSPPSASSAAPVCASGYGPVRGSAV
ncbi:hypothetical protein F6476_19740 [Pseudomonas umsongensis]|nr:hypothetical protein F6476_19740 [Pseudomonas umsongensis]